MRLFEVHLEVEDIDRSLAFYQAILPHEKLHRWKDGSAVALVLEDGAALGLWKKGKHGRFNGRAGEHVHFAFSIADEDYEQHKSRVVALGVEIFEMSEGQDRSIYFFAPDGHQGEFYTASRFA